MTYYKAVRHDYGSFTDPEFKYGPNGTVVKHQNPGETGDHSAEHYLSVSVSPTDCSGFQWRVDGKDSRMLLVEPIGGFQWRVDGKDSRMLLVEPIGDVWTPHPKQLPSKRAVVQLRVVGELPISVAFGQNGDALTAYLDLLPTLTAKQWVAAWVTARDAAWVTAWDAARVAARDAAWAAAWAAAQDAAWVTARDAAWHAAWHAAWDAARVAARAGGAVAVRHLITPEQFNSLTAPMHAAGINFDTLGKASA